MQQEDFKNKQKNQISMKNWFFLLLTVLALSACVDQEFDAPPFGEILEEAPEVTGTIADLKALHILGTFAEIEEDITIRAIVSADDQTGNLFRRLVIQDETGAIELNINAVELHNFFPEGREIFVKCQGLWIGDFAGLVGIGGALGETGGGDPRLDGIEEVLLDQFITRGSTGNEVVPVSRTINELSTADISTLVQIDNIEFESSELGQTYADFQQNTNRFLEDCNGNGIIIRTSGFSDFYNTPLPEGNGTVTAIYTVFGDTKQLLVRRPEEVALNGKRCDGSSGGGGGNIDPMELPEATTTIAELKTTHTFGTFTNINNDGFIRGVITADDASGNFFRKIMVQDGSAGIELLVNETDLADNFGLEIGREIAVQLNGMILNDFQDNISLGGSTFTNGSGNQQLGGIESGDISTQIIIGETGMNVTPTVRTIDELTNADIHSLVRIENLQFTDNSVGETLADIDNNFSRNLDLEDCDGNEIIIRTSNFASYADAFSPGGNGSITAIYSLFGGDRQLFIRELSDLSMSGNRCDGSAGGGGGGNPGTDQVNVDFEGLTVFDVLEVPGWTNFAEAGSLANHWIVREFDDNTYAQISAFQSTDANNIGWFISPAIEASNTARLSFRMGQCHWAHDGMSVLISNNFTGDPTTANWQTVDCTLPNENNDFWEFVPSGDVDLDDYFASGTVHIAFRYEGQANGQETTFILDDIVVTE